MVQIVVSPERLESVAHLFETKKGEMESIIQTLRSTMQSLDAEWDGVAQNRFYAQWNETLPRLVQTASLFGDIAAELRRIAQAFREVDERVI